MGNSIKKTLTINLDRTDAFYFADEIICGTVDLHIIKGKIEAREVYIQVIGAMGYSLQQATTDSNGDMSTETDYNHIPF